MANARQGTIKIARMMIKRHGLQASAVAHERETMARLAPDAGNLALWRVVQRAIAELRNTSYDAEAERRLEA